MIAVHSVGTALPPFRVDNSEITAAVRTWLGAESPESHLFERYLAAAHTAHRAFVLPPAEIINQRGSEARAAMFEREGSALALQATRRALEKANLTPSDIDALVFTSCSVPVIPGIDTYLIDELEMRRDLLRIPAYQFGCAGGLIGIGLAHRLAGSFRHALLVSSELCSLVFHEDDHARSQLVAAAIFGDGAAAAVVSHGVPGPRLEIIAHRSELLPHSRNLMGYDIRDNGLHRRLDKALPAQLTEEIPGLVERLLTAQGMGPESVRWWLFHPGGTKILEALEHVLRLERAQCHWAWDVLRDHGNLSSATILFVIERFLGSGEAKPGDLAMIVGVGPGLTVEAILARVCE